MSESFSQKSARVIVVDTSGPVRQMMSDVVRSLSFPTVEGKGSMADVLAHLEIEPVDWIIAPLMADQTVNAMHLLNIISQMPHLKNTRVSLLLTEDERYVLPTAFELGALSWHAKPFTKDTLKESLLDLNRRLEAAAWNETIVSSSYLRTELADSKQVGGLLQLEKSLVGLFPGNAERMLDLARAQHANGLAPAAKATLGQIKLLAPERTAAIDEVAQTLFSSTDLSSDSDAGVNALGLKTIVIVDSDETVTKDLEKILNEVGVEDIKIFHDGESAWAYLNEASEPDLIIHEWRLPKVSGPYLVQKIRGKGYTNVPVIIVSSLLKPADMPLLREMGVAQIVNKPLVKNEFMSGLVWTIQQDRAPSEQQALERKIRSLLGCRKHKEAKALRSKFLASADVSIAKKKLVEAEFYFADKDYQKARECGIESLKSSADSIIVLNLLGKVFMQLNEFGSALKCFEKAQNLSPRNVERLCTIAEVHTELGNEEAATEALESAESQDAGSDQVTEAKAKVALAKGDITAATQAMSKLESLSTLLGYMNNKAVALARCGQIDNAILLYENTCTSIPQDRQDLVAIVKYNLALALIRADDLQKAAIVLTEVQSIKKSRVLKKAASLGQRVKNALQTGAPLQLQSSVSEEASPSGKSANGDAGTGDQGAAEEKHDEYSMQIDAEPGDLRCFKVFYNSVEEDVRVGSLLSSPPRFQPRSAIAREESFGTERMAKAAS